MEQMRKLPIGIQTFEKLREENYLLCRQNSNGL